MRSRIFDDAMNEKQVLEYFRDKADAYDDVDSQVYWQLSDKLLWYLLNTNVLKKLKPDFRFLDAGGGTGRWSQKVLGAYPRSQGLIYDLSPEMLKQAEKKRRNGLESRLKLVEGNIEHMVVADSTFDLSFTFHNVLGFVNSPQRALSEIVRVTKSRGYIVAVVPNLYHNIFFNISLGKVNEAQQYLGSEKGKFTNNMPSMHLFTPDSIKAIYSSLGLTNTALFGFPVTIYPGYQETQISGSSRKIADILSQKDIFNSIYSIEKNLSTRSDSVARGNNLLIVGRKK
jgi:ubiquinone/menaquinone biosynthesis C-methylase UbiE